MTARTASRRVVAADAVASAGLGALLAAGAPVLDSAFGTSATALIAIGAVCVAWAGILAWLLARREITAAALRNVIALNVVWLVASGAIAIEGWSGRTTLGTAFVVVQALAVAALTDAQFMAWRAARAAGPALATVS